MRRFVLVSFVTLAAIALSSPAMAQRVAFSINLTDLGATDVMPVDDDGNPATYAWLLTLERPEGDDQAPERRQLVVSGRIGLCFEEPFPVPGTTNESEIVIVREGRRDMLKVVPSKTVTLVPNPDGTWRLSYPKYEPIELQRTLCR